MSGLIFPNYLPGLLFTQKKSPNFRTAVHAAMTGKESRISFQGFPLYKWELGYELLRDYADGQTNLVLYSQDATQWAAAQNGTGIAPIVLSNNIVAPDGTLTADRIILNINGGTTSSDTSYVAPNTFTLPGNTTYTLSFWAKTNDGSTVAIWPAASALGGLVTVGPTWQRLSKTWTSAVAGSTVTFLLGGSSATAKYADMSLWGVQVEYGATMGGYIPTNGAANVVGDLKTLFGLFNQMLGQQDTFLYQDPDFNTVIYQQFGTGTGSQTAWQLTAQYKPEPGYPGPYGLAGLPELIQSTNGAPQIFVNRWGVNEPVSTGSRTNLALQSADLTQAAWTKNNCTITANATAAPDGTVTAAKIVETATTTFHGVSQSLSVSSGQRITTSVYMKASERTWGMMTEGNLVTASAWFDLVNGVLGSVTGTGNPVATITPATNGWYLCTLTYSTGGTSANIQSRPATGDLQSSYLGVAGSGIFSWGPQFETGPIATKYMPSGASTANNGGSDYSVGATGLVTFAAAPALNWALTWSGSFYYRCRFSADSYDFSAFARQFWDLKRIGFQQVKL